MSLQNSSTLLLFVVSFLLSSFPAPTFLLHHSVRRQPVCCEHKLQNVVLLVRKPHYSIPSADLHLGTLLIKDWEYIPSDKMSRHEGVGKYSKLRKGGSLKFVLAFTSSSFHLIAPNTFFFYNSSDWQIRWGGQNNLQHVWHPLNRHDSLGNI